jgi:UDP-glucose 4-epimerase
MNSRKILVTGGGGFIGSHLVDRLLDEGNHVTVYDNLSSGKNEFLSHHDGNTRFRLVKADLLDFETLLRAIEGHEVVFHLSANPDARRGIEDTSLDLKQETEATYHVLEAMRRNRIGKIVFSSSGTVYGETPVIPLAENYGPLFPISLYGAGKLASEGLISAFCHTFNVQAWIMRFANVIGSRTTHGVIFDFLQKLKDNPGELEILGDGTQEKPYLHVADCVDGILFAFEHSDERINVFNLGPDSSTDVTTIANIIGERLGLRDVAFKYTGGERGWPGDVPQVRYDIKKMKTLGWQASLTSDEAVKKALEDILSSMTT